MNKQHGFTLIELLFIIAILAILAAIAIPPYQQYIKDSRLREAHTLLLKNAHIMEQFYQQNRSFKQTSTTWPQLPETSTRHFCIRPQGNARGALNDKFTLKAVAINKNYEPRVLKINESLITTICESSTNSCDEEGDFFLSKDSEDKSPTDKNCTIYQ
ncbi:prepilin-type N-terminal cleavage/methylation domain-containing protein [Neisseria sp. Dent CA1/247]|uniref:type IV pilin protein n=1 Tax=Neisseria TaxID=482 RepID=UPI001FD3BCEB|nr:MULTISPECIES: type IV pilin protein [Neisseria]MDO5069571.1 type IV pilin protein [Neisseria zoodegmatis]UOO77652.1 prepilin-type N-terminal cleavage/methylation domain-containing protein [Neisseria sp. Dent CA1/247]